jgi:hypothetical protein
MTVPSQDLNTTISHQEFNRSVAWDLILEGGDETLKANTAARKNHGPRSTYVATCSDLPHDRLVGQYLPSKGPRRRCWLCNFKVQRSDLRQGTQALAQQLGKDIRAVEPEVRTVNRCETCNKNLCFSEARNCWAEFHRLPPSASDSDE